MEAGGFDVVIGNPPYLSFSGRQRDAAYKDLLPYWQARYAWEGWPTVHGLFLLKAVELARPEAYASMVLPDQVGHLDGYSWLRRSIAETSALIEVRYWGERVFRQAVTPVMTVVLARREPANPTLIVGREGARAWLDVSGGDPWVLRAFRGLLSKIEAAGSTLGGSVRDPGVHTGNCAGKLIAQGLRAEEESSVPLLEGKQVGRYVCRPPAKRLRLAYSRRPGEYFRIGPEEAYRRAHFVIRQTATHPIVGPREGAVYFRNSLLAL